MSALIFTIVVIALALGSAPLLRRCFARGRGTVIVTLTLDTAKWEAAMKQCVAGFYSIEAAGRRGSDALAKLIEAWDKL